VQQLNNEVELRKRPVSLGRWSTDVFGRRKRVFAFWLTNEKESNVNWYYQRNQDDMTQESPFPVIEATRNLISGKFVDLKEPLVD
jgi:hypothetical protein